MMLEKRTAGRGREEVKELGETWANVDRSALSGEAVGFVAAAPHSP